MALAETHSVTRSFSSLLIAPFAAVGRFLVLMSENDSRLKQVEFLRSLTDEELAERGLEREDIVRHVFSAYLYL